MSKTDKRVQKPLRFDPIQIKRINRIRGSVEAVSGEKYSDQSFYNMLINEGLKKFESEYNQSK